MFLCGYVIYYEIFRSFFTHALVKHTGKMEPKLQRQKKPRKEKVQSSRLKFSFCFLRINIIILLLLLLFLHKFFFQFFTSDDLNLMKLILSIWKKTDKNIVPTKQKFVVVVVHFQKKKKTFNNVSLSYSSVHPCFFSV